MTVILIDRLDIVMSFKTLYHPQVLQQSREWEACFQSQFWKMDGYGVGGDGNERRSNIFNSPFSCVRKSSINDHSCVCVCECVCASVCVSRSTAFTSKQTWPQARLILIPSSIHFWQLWLSPKEHSTQFLAKSFSSLRQNKLIPRMTPLTCFNPSIERLF